MMTTWPSECRDGFELAVAHDLFVHHFGSRTFQGNGIDAERLLKENAAKFAAVWGRKSVGVPVTLPSWTPGKSHAPAVTKAKISLTLIVRDEEKNLPACLSSVAGLFDEIIVVDTGSKDRTRMIALEFGARVFDFVWVDDFAAARNAALARATGDYAFWLDADDVVDPPEREKLRELLDGLPSGSGGGQGSPVGLARTLDPPYELSEGLPSGSDGRRGSPVGLARTLDPPYGHMPTAARKGWLGQNAPGEPCDGNAPAAYVVRCSCDPGRNGDGGQTVVDHIRLFPVREDVRWSYAVHEQILPALRRANVTVRWTDVTVRHTGYADPALRERKLQRDHKILEAELAERPDDPFVLFNLGSIAVERQDWRTALGHLQRSLRGSGPKDSIVRKLFALIARCHQSLGDIPSALAMLRRGPAARPR